jgi:hypothetical protein
MAAAEVSSILICAQSPSLLPTCSPTPHNQKKTAHKKETGTTDGTETHPVNNLAQQEIVQLTEDEQDRADEVVPHGTDLVQDGEVIRPK